MAIQSGGDGSQANPYVIDNSDGLAWSDFNTLNSNYTGKYITFADVHVDGNGNYEISGAGTSTDPFIVSTYREMLDCTGATEIWEVKLINADNLIYRYGDLYCKYDRAPTLIDLSSADIYPQGTGELDISNDVDCNGWTFTNLMFAGLTSSTNTVFRRAFMLNWLGTGAFLFKKKLTECIADITWAPPSDINSWIWDGSGLDVCNSSLVIKATGSRIGLTKSYTWMYDSILDFTINSLVFEPLEFGTHGVVLNRCVLKGSTTATTQHRHVCRPANSSIVDFDAPNLNTFMLCDDDGTVNSLYNKNKITPSSSYSGWIAVSSDELLNPATLQSKGFSIGVDSNGV